MSKEFSGRGIRCVDGVEREEVLLTVDADATEGKSEGRAEEGFPALKTGKTLSTVGL